MPGKPTFTYQPPETHAGCVLCTVAADGSTIVRSIPPDSIITVQTLATAPPPAEIYSGISDTDACAAVNGQLSNFGVAP